MNAHTNLHSHFHVTLRRRAQLGIFALILACLAMLSLSGCVGLTGAGTPAAKSNSSSNSGTLAASATSLNFGNVVAGSSSPQTLTLTNTGTAVVTISQATITGAGFSVVGGMSSVSIAAGQNHAFQVQFAPTGTGSASGSISIASDATNSPLTVSLSGTEMTGTGLAITVHPANQSVIAGQTATFTVVATGKGTLTYQWKKSGAAISGATSASYTTPAVTSSETGAQFTVVVTDSDGSLTSNPATLTVTSSAVAPSITTQPANKTVTAGQTATFSVTATGTAPLTYQWKKNGATISGAASASYTTPATAASDNGTQFTVTVTNSVSSAASNAAKLTVNAAGTLNLNASPLSLNFSSVNLGSNHILPVTFTNGGNSDVTISNVTISGAGYTASGVQSGQIVSPGQTATLNVTFAPAATGLIPGSIKVASNAANSQASITLAGTGVQTVSHSVDLIWTASASTVSGYNGYRSTVSGGPYTKVNSSPVAATTFTDTTVQASQTYFFVVTSVDSSGVESANSTEVSAIIP